MKMVKSLLLGAAAGLVATVGAQAADLPVKAKAVEYVKICSLYGKGFYYIPGTDICLKLGGRVRYDYTLNARSSFFPYLNGTAAHYNRGSNDADDRARAYVRVDTRQQTAYGTLRTYLSIYAHQRNAEGSGIVLERGFIQFAGFTMGFASSFYDHYVTPRYSYQTNVIGSDTGGSGQNVFGYTAQLGNGVSISLAAEDEDRRRTFLADAAAGLVGSIVTGVVPAGARAYGAFQLPDFVANIRVDQAWGSAQVMGALHQVRADYYTIGGVNVEGNGSPSDEWGWALGVGLHFNVPTGAKDTFSVQANWTSGAISYAASGLTGVGVFQGTSLAHGIVADGMYNTVAGVGTGIELTDAWSFYAGYQHYWMPNLRSSIYGGMVEVNYGGNATAWLNAAYGCNPANGVCSPDFTYWQLGTRTVWNPVPGLEFGVDVMYHNVDTAYAGQTCFGCAPGGFKPVANYNYTDQDWITAIFRVERNY